LRNDGVRIIGSYLSPYVRKVLVCLELKGIAYEIDPIVPFYGNDEFAKISPLRRIPVLIDGEVTLCDSTVICEYLEDSRPQPPLYPQTPAQRARARWLEEFADSRMGDVFIWRLFNQFVIRRGVWGEQANKDLVARTLQVDAPQVLDYLEGEMPAEGFLFGNVSLADVSIACFFRNASYARFEIDAARWPIAAGFVARVLALEPFQRLKRFEDMLVRTPIAGHRNSLAEMGAPLTADTWGSPAPRRGVMPV